MHRTLPSALEKLPFYLELIFLSIWELYFIESLWLGVGNILCLRSRVFGQWNRCTIEFCLRLLFMISRYHVMRLWKYNSFFTTLDFCCCCCSVTHSCPALCDPMDCSMPAFPIASHLLEFAQVHIHGISDAIQPSHPLTPSSNSALNLSQHQRGF